MTPHDGRLRGLTGEMRLTRGSRLLRRHSVLLGVGLLPLLGCAGWAAPGGAPHQVPSGAPPPAATPGPAPAGGDLAQPVVPARSVAGTPGDWRRDAAQMSRVGPPSQVIPGGISAFLPPQRPTARSGVVVRIEGMVRIPTCIGDCDGYEQFLNWHVGGRLSAFLQQGPCSERPPAPDARHRPLVRSFDSGARRTSPYVDLPPGQYGARARIPLQGLGRGTWYVCSWLDVREDLPVSNPTLGLPPEMIQGGLGFGIPYGLSGPQRGGRVLRLR